jgi:hypothetical protein
MAIHTRKVSARRAKRRGVRNWQMVINKPARQYLKVWLKAQTDVELSDEEKEILQDETKATFAYQQLILRPIMQGLAMHAVTNGVRLPENMGAEYAMAIVKKAGQLAGAFDRMIMVQQPDESFLGLDACLETLKDPDEYRDNPDREHNAAASRSAGRPRSTTETLR